MNATVTSIDKAKSDSRDLETTGSDSMPLNGEQAAEAKAEAKTAAKKTPAKKPAAKKTPAKKAVAKKAAASKSPAKEAPAGPSTDLPELFPPELFAPTAFHIPETTSFPAWVRAFDVLEVVSQGHQFWIGDALLFGEERFRDKASSAIDPMKWEPKTLLNYRRVADRLPQEIRLEGVSWTSHRYAAELDTVAQRKRAIAYCLKNSLTTKEMMEYCQKLQGKTPKGEDEGDSVKPGSGRFGVSLTLTGQKAQTEQIDKIMRGAKLYIEQQSKKLGLVDHKVTESKK